MAKRNIETELRGVKITPVLLGADLNCYNVARAFHEAYAMPSADIRSEIPSTAA